MRTEIICRFATKEDLELFNTNNNLNIAYNTTYYDVHAKEQKLKRISKSNLKPRLEHWKEHWLEMPQYVSNKQQQYAKVVFKFNGQDLHLAKKLFNQNITDKTTSVWFPKLVAGTYSKKRVVGGESRTRYPIYIVSKGRSNLCYTSIFLTQMEVPHYVVVEPQEVKSYKEFVGNDYATILELDMKYRDSYDTFDELGSTKSKGPGGARNFCWEHSLSNGYKWHWVFDDNATEGFHYMYFNEKIKCRSGAIFRAMEDFVDRYDNLAIAGLNYSKFCKSSDKTPAFVLNTRIYSFLLIRNDIPYRWRGRYNEDTDLSLRVLKDGWCTVQFNAFLAGKATTQKIAGGNTKEFYEKEGTYAKSKMLEDMHPDVAKLVWKFHRWHHQVDYSSFKQKLCFKDGLNFSSNVNMYGMQIIDTDEVNTNDTKSYLERKYLKKI